MRQFDLTRNGAKRFALHAAVTLALVGAAGLALAVSGLVSIAASAGHWDLTAWFLHATMQRAVAVQSALTEPPPDLDDVALIQRGAGHYQNGCAPCHGAPGVPQGAVVLSMTPEPPYLPPRIPTWEKDELHWIVLHGIKYSGMPAWATQERPAEPWSVVAFLLQLPGMDAATYRDLAYGPALDAAPPADAPPAIAEVLTGECARCHGYDGQGRGTGAAPKIGGQKETYLYASLQAYAGAHRYSGIMQPQAKGLDDSTLKALARHYTAAEAPAPPADPIEADPDLLAEGETIAKQGVVADGVPACVACHGPNAPRRHPLYPNLAGQHADYLQTQLHLWREGGRGGTPFAHLMTAAAKRMSDRQIEAVAAWYASK